MNLEELIAWYIYPEPHGTNYLEEDLTKEIVLEIFDYSQILLAIITRKGWKCLFEKFGIKELIEIDRVSGWLEDDDLGEWILSFYTISIESGYDPTCKALGVFDSEKNLFTDENNNCYSIDWSAIYKLKEELKF